MKAPKLPPPEVVRGRLLYVGHWYGHTVYRDTLGADNCKYVCRVNSQWYRSPSIRDLLAIPVESAEEPSRRDQVLFCLSAIDRLVLDLGEMRPQLRHLLLQFQIILNEIKDEDR